jgi:ABC-type polysaccharide/polyol phosphate transport system ATPase subunit
MNAIDVTHATKIYRRFSHRKQFATLKSALLTGSLIRDLRADERFVAVNDVSFSIARGTTFGIVGRNGSGKSTMLKLVAGITKPTTGEVVVNGRISALIELGAGFHPEISGRENVFINGIMLGLTKREVARRFDEIVEFAELEEFIDAPVKTYSSGMYMRLGFAVAIHVDPDVLLVDEVLAVGDESFTHKCLDKFAEFKRRGKTILLVTHSLGLVERFCDEALWLDAGRVRAHGDPKRVVDTYITDVGRSEEQHLAAEDARARQVVAQAATEAQPATPTRTEMPDKPIDQFRAAEGQPSTSSDRPEQPVDGFRAVEGRWGSREVEITDVQVVGPVGDAGHVFQSGEPMTVRVAIRANTPVEDFVIGVGIFNVEGVCCYGTNTDIDELRSQSFSGDGQVSFRIESLDLVEGTYKLDVAAHRRDGYPYDYHRLLYTFRVKSRTRDVGIYRPKHEWVFSPALHFTRTTSGA